MGIISFENTIPLEWHNHKHYQLSTVDEYIRKIAPQDADRHLNSLRKLMREEFPSTQEADWSDFLAKEIIFPVPGSELHCYNPWDETAKLESFRDFAGLWRNNSLPNDQVILAWAQKYGLPCNDATANSLSGSWGYTPLHITLLRNIELSKILQRQTHSIYLEGIVGSDFFSRNRSSMLRDVFIELAREAYFAYTLFRCLNSKDIPHDFDPAMLALMSQSETWHRVPSGFKNPEIPFSEMWASLNDLMSSRFRGLHISLKAKKVDHFPNIEFIQAFKADDLLTVMWVRFYDQVLELGPSDKCPCGKLFFKTRPNQKYCDKYCQNRYNQQSFRANRKLTEAEKL